MFSINMLNGFFDPLINWFADLFYFISLCVYDIFVCGIGKIVDVIQLLFRKFAGLESMSLGGESQEGDIVLQFINSDIVQKVFWAMVVLAVVLLLIASFVAVIKTEFDKDGKNDKKKVIKSAFRGIVNFVAVPIVCIFGLIVGNALLKTIDGALNRTSATTSMTSQIFAAGGYNANRVRSYEGTGENGVGYIPESMAYYIANGYGNFGIFTEDTTGAIKQSIADKIDSAFANNLTVDLNNLTENEKTLVYANGENNDYGYVYRKNFSHNRFPSGYKKFFSNDGSIGANTNKYIKFNKENVDKLTFSIYNVGLVSYYYDLSLVSFDYLVTTIALIFAAWIYLTTILGLIKRLFMLVTLFIISPPICALYPLDEGKALGSWRSEFVKQALSAYSVVIVMNIFFLLLPLMLQIQIFPAGSKIPGLEFISSGFVNYFARDLIVIGALTFFKQAISTISSIIGAGDASADGSGAAGNFTKNVGRVAAGAALGAGVAKTVVDGAGKFISKTADGLGGLVDKRSKNKMNKEDIDKQAQEDAIEGQEKDSGKLSGGTDTNGKGFATSESSPTESNAPTTASDASSSTSSATTSASDASSS
ncbi:MAG: Mbov_0396 family ICE element transmembrane protein, partial [Christensenellales bacterium]